MERLNYSKNKVEEEREIRKQTEEHLNVIISQLDKEKKQIQEDLEYKIKTKSLTIENQMEQITKLEKALNKAKESLQSTVEQNEENKKNINSLEEKNNDLEEQNCELKNQISQIKKELKKAQTQMHNKNDNPFERMAIW